MCHLVLCDICFFFNAPATTEIYTLSLHDALPISIETANGSLKRRIEQSMKLRGSSDFPNLRSYRLFIERIVDKLNKRCRGRLAEEQRSEEHTSELQSHSFISYAVFCLKKKKTILFFFFSIFFFPYPSSVYFHVCPSYSPMSQTAPITFFCFT